MRRLVTMLVILLTVLVVGMSALVMFVDPNDFRDYMVRQVEKKSGYQLNLDSNLRWHVWPELSIIAGSVTLTAAGAQMPMISAENMRLDVKLWPLLSHQLEVKQVMLKGAVIRLTPASEVQQRPDAPVAPASKTNPVNANTFWKLDINTVQLVDGLLIWQQADNSQINVRNLNLDLVQNKQRQIKVLLSSRVNRNQRDLTFSLSADLDLQQYPQQVSANVHEFTYRLEGADIPIGGINGQGSVQARYQQASRQAVLSQLSINANNNLFTGNAHADLNGIPSYLINLTAENINLDTILDWQLSESDGSSEKETPKSRQTIMVAPIIATQYEDIPQDLEALRDFNAQLILSANNLVYRGITVNKLDFFAENQQGKVRINRLSGSALEGDFSIPGNIDVTGKKMQVTLEPAVNHMEFGPVLDMVGLPQVLTGRFSIVGKLAGADFNIDAFSKHWDGNAQFKMESAQLRGINIQQLVQQAVTRSTSEINGPEHYNRDTAVQQLEANLVLNQGMLKISKLQGESALLALKGNGIVDLPMQQFDMNLNVRIIEGWQGKAALVKILQNTEVPLRVYGPWRQLKYKLDIESLLRDDLQQKAKKALNNWIENNKESRGTDELNKLLNKH